VDGIGVDAHLLRSMSRASNRLRQKNQLLWRYMADASTDNAEDTRGRANMVAHWPDWSRFSFPAFVPKKPHQTRGSAYLTAQVSDSDTVYVQIGTRRAPFNPRAISTADYRFPNTIRAVGDGDNDFDRYTLTDIPLLDATAESFDVWVMGTATDTNIDTGVLGTPSSGTVSSASQFSFLDFAASWNAAAFNASLGSRVYVRFEDNDGNVMLMRRVIRAVSGIQLSFFPGITNSEARMILGSTYRLKLLSTIRIADLCIYTDEM